MKVKSLRDFLCGLVLVALGIVFAWPARGWGLGAGGHIGAGYFPLVLAVVLAALGVLVVFKSLVLETESGEPASPWGWRPLALVVLANALFAAFVGGVPRLKLPALGLVPAIVLLLAAAVFAGERYSKRELALVVAVLAVLGVFAARVLLHIEVPP